MKTAVDRARPTVMDGFNDWSSSLIDAFIIIIISNVYSGWLRIIR